MIRTMRLVLSVVITLRVMHHAERDDYTETSSIANPLSIPQTSQSKSCEV